MRPELPPQPGWIEIRKLHGVQPLIATDGREIWCRGLPFDDAYATGAHSGEIRYKTGQFLARALAFADRRGGCDKPRLIGINTKRGPHPAQEQRHLGRLRADVSMGLIEHDPAQTAA